VFDNVIIIIIVLFFIIELHFHLTIHEQDIQGCRALTAALAQNINLNLIHRYSIYIDFWQIHRGTCS